MRVLSTLRRALRKRSRFVGTAPGELLAPEPTEARATTISAIVYDADQVVEEDLRDAAHAAELAARLGIKWFDVDGVHDPRPLQELGKTLGLHPLIVEDMVNTDQRTKIEEYDGVLFAVLRRFYIEDEEGHLSDEQISIVLTQDTVVSIGEKETEQFQVVFDYLRSGKPRVRLLHADYLAYRLMDSVLDSYYIVLDRISERLENVGDDLSKKVTPQSLAPLFEIKNDLLFLRKSVWPLRDVLTTLVRGGSPLIRPEMLPFYRDLYDHAVRVMDIIETFRELQSGKLDLYMSVLSYRQNEVMRVLTVAATIFLPLTFLAGVWGMNFENMPELGWRLGYLFAWGAMALLAFGMLAFFRRKKWL